MNLSEFQALPPREARRMALGSLPDGYLGSFNTHTPRRGTRTIAKRAAAIAREPEARHQRRKPSRKVRAFA